MLSWTKRSRLLLLTLLLLLLLFYFTPALERPACKPPIREKCNTLNPPFYVFIKDTDVERNDFLFVHGANVETLKKICTALAECTAFNSVGWLKGATGPKIKLSGTDLYLKKMPVEDKEEYPMVDSSAGIFSSQINEYVEMEENMKIFIYPTTVGVGMLSVDDYKYGVEQLFIDLLSNSHFSVSAEEAAEAHFYFIPSRCTAYRKSRPQNQRALGEVVAMKTTRDMVDDIIRSYPYWNRSSGMDHFYICAHDMGTNVANLSHSDMRTNAIALVNTADYSKPHFVVHKDISLPPHPGRGTVNWPLLGMGGAGIPLQQRSNLMFFAGNPSRGPVRPILFEKFGSAPGCRLVRGYIAEEEYIHALQTTKFCLCPSGLEVWSPRLMDALWFGCVPVVISDHYVLPLSNYLDWEKISYRIPESRVSQLITILEGVSDDELLEKQKNIVKFYQHLTWNNPPRPYDAFYSVLFELWQHKHGSRTMDKHEFKSSH